MQAPSRLPQFVGKICCGTAHCIHCGFSIFRRFDFRAGHADYFPGNLAVQLVVLSQQHSPAGIIRPLQLGDAVVLLSALLAVGAYQSLDV